jgi:hypothetical protein
MPNELGGWCRARPPRVAFLIEDCERADIALDGIFADCYARWGGRFSLIVPCSEGRVAGSHWPWLEAFDPDIIYSYVPLSQADVLEIHERLFPSKYFFHKIQDAHEEPRVELINPRPSYRFSLLSSLSTIFRLARSRSPLGGTSGIRIIDS